jgi:hypothetical protein
MSDIDPVDELLSLQCGAACATNQRRVIFG